MSLEHSPNNPESNAARFDFLEERSEMARLIRQKDWSKTPVGAVEHWPQRLKNALALCLDSKIATYVWWGDGCTTFYNDAAIAHLRGRHPAALGKPAREIWREAWSELEPLVDKTLAGEGALAENFELKPQSDDNSGSAYFTFCYAPLRNERGQISGLFVISIETTDMVHSKATLRASEQRFRAIVDSASEYAIITFDDEGRITSWNSGAERLLGYSEEEAIGQPGDIFFTPEDRAAGAPAIEITRTREEGRALDERWHMRKDGSTFWGSGLMLPMEGDPRDHYLKIFRDQTAARRAEQRLRLMSEELNHRVKNTLTVVQSIAMQTLRQSANVEEARDALESRLVALARAHDVLTQSRWTGGDLRKTVENTLQLILHDEALDTRVHLAGPDIHIGPGALVGISLAIHELATNAVKYGAMANDSGEIDLRWEITQDTPECFRMRWTERGGPAVATPRRRGFGSRMIEEGLAHEFDGRVELKFASGGVECTIQAPLKEITDIT